MTSVGLGIAGVLIVASAVGVWVQAKLRFAALDEAFDVAWCVPDPALTEDAEVAALDELYYDVPAFGEVRS